MKKLSLLFLIIGISKAGSLNNIKLYFDQMDTSNKMDDLDRKKNEIIAASNLNRESIAQIRNDAQELEMIINEFDRGYREELNEKKRAKMRELRLRARNEFSIMARTVIEKSWNFLEYERDYINCLQLELFELIKESLYVKTEIVPLASTAEQKMELSVVIANNDVRVLRQKAEIQERKNSLNEAEVMVRVNKANEPGFGA